MAPLTIKTTGHARATRVPERAHLRLTVKDSGPKPATVASNVQSTTARVHSILSSLTATKQSTDQSSPALNYTVGPVTSYSFWRTESMSKASKQHATSVVFDVEFADFTALGAVAAQLSAVEFVHPLGIEWRLTDATKEVVASGARAEACAEALKKARDYTRGLGREDGAGRIEAVDVLECGSGSGSGGNGGFKVLDVLMDRGQRYSSSGDLGWSFQPAEIEFRVDLDVKFVVE
ncbi:hypothetical protein BJY01DRAFT_216931 [Aspergillus pseudoustus]|uniref:DUF541 domain-containing protein n=1 Tax=Aspergillus pseudoustus TaxID=1810923 RepID=A0ABR4JQ98_9EURO